MSTPEVSVVIPVYNRASMLHEAVASVLAQKDVRCELIVVDDGSTDGGCHGLKAWLSSAAPPSITSITLMRCRENHGVAYARNRGVAMATARFIAFLDSDDLWAPSKLARQVAFMHSAPDCAIAQTQEIWIRNGRRVNPGVRHRKRSGDIFVDSLQTCLISPSAVIMRTELFRRLGGFDERMKAAEDYDLWLRILQHYEVGLIDAPLVTRRAGHRGQLSAETPAIDRFRLLTLMKLLNACDLSAQRRSAIVEVLSEKCGIYAKGLCRRGDQSAAGFILKVAERAQAWTAARDDKLVEMISKMGAMLPATVNPVRADTQHFEAGAS